MQLRFFSILLLIFSGFSFGIGPPNERCIDSMKALGGKVEDELWPSFNRDTCSTGKKPGWRDWPFVEKNLVKPLFKKLQARMKLPPYEPKIKRLADSIVQGCAKKHNTNFCDKSQIEKFKSCAIDKTMGFMMANLDFADKYGDEENCRKLEDAISDKRIWAWAKTFVVKFAKYFASHSGKSQRDLD